MATSWRGFKEGNWRENYGDFRYVVELNLKLFLVKKLKSRIQIIAGHGIFNNNSK